MEWSFMTVYLVDFENVRSSGLVGVEQLGPNDKVVIFYSKNADAITFDVHMLLNKSKAELDIFMITKGGRNSLDFQLSTYLGYLVMENKYNNIVIISKDKGFLYATSFWEENSDYCNAHIYICKSIKAFFDNESITDESWDDVLSGKSDEADLNNKTGDLEEKSTGIMHLNDSNAYASDNNRDGLKDIKKDNKRDVKKDNNRDNKKDKKKDNAKDNKKSAKTGIIQKTFGKNRFAKVKTAKEKSAAAEVKLNISDDVRGLIGEKYGNEDVPMIVDIIGKSADKQDLYVTLVQKLGQEKGHDMYILIKSKFKDLKNK